MTPAFVTVAFVKGLVEPEMRFDGFALGFGDGCAHFSPTGGLSGTDPFHLHNHLLDRASRYDLDQPKTKQCDPQESRDNQQETANKVIYALHVGILLGKVVDGNFVIVEAVSKRPNLSKFGDCLHTSLAHAFQAGVCNKLTQRQLLSIYGKK